MITILIVIMALVIATPAFASVNASYINGGYYESFGPIFISQYAPTTLAFSQKYDLTQHYFWYDGNVEVLYVRSLGSAYSDGTGAINTTCNNGVIVSCAVCEPDQEYKIKNYVGEYVLSWCALSFLPHSFSGSIEGYWNPDLHTSDSGVIFPETISLS